MSNNVPRLTVDGLPLLLTIEQVCELLGSGRTRVYEWIASGRLASVKLGSSRRVPTTALAAFIAALSDASE